MFLNLRVEVVTNIKLKHNCADSNEFTLPCLVPLQQVKNCHDYINKDYC